MLPCEVFHMRALRISVAVVVFIALVGLAQAQQAAQAALPTPSVKVGEMAPDFTLKDQNGKMISLHDFKGKQNVALAFYVFAFSPN
jgi:cytochrome oxidase Cu insertion factor (SCO1/SenC/PrrC family)